MQTTTKVSFPSSSQYIQGIYRVIVSHVQLYAHLKKKQKNKRHKGKQKLGVSGEGRNSVFGYRETTAHVCPTF